MSSCCEVCGVETESTMHALIRCSHATALRQRMRHEWNLPDEEQFNLLTPEKLLDWFLNLGIDVGAQVLLLFWRTWYVRNKLTHTTDKLSIEGSTRFLGKYWLELCNVRQQKSSFDSKGKEPVLDSLITKKEGMPMVADTSWEPPPAGWLKLNVDGSFLPE